MVIINLLPWREEKQAYEKRMGIGMVVVVLCAVLLILLSMYAFVSYQEAAVRDRIRQIKQTLTRLEGMQRNLNTQTIQSAPSDVLTRWVAYREATHAMLMMLGKSLAGETCFTAITRQKNAVIFSGYARSNSDMLALIKQWQSAHVFADITLLQLQPHHQWVQFRFRAQELTPFAAEPQHAI
jgi:Tfp pilus assembly protein PilN